MGLRRLPQRGKRRIVRFELQYGSLVRTAGRNTVGDLGCQSERRAPSRGLTHKIQCDRQVFRRVVRRIQVDQSCAQKGLVREHRVKLARPVERIKVVAAAHMRVPDEDLRHGVPTIGPLHHFTTQLGVSADIEF